jgi:hypothetical protein
MPIQMLFAFAQLEFTHGIGPPPGRYVVGLPGAPAVTATGPSDIVTGVSLALGAADVLVISLVGAPAPSPGRLRRRRARAAGSDEPRREVPLLLATFVRASAPICDPAAATAFIQRVRESAVEGDLEVAAALAVVNRALAAHRAAAHDPYARDVTRDDAREARIGYGHPEQVARGAWTEAITLPAARSAPVKRVERLRPVEVMAEILAGQRDLLEGDELLLRASLDLEHGRLRAAAVGLHAGIELLCAELSGAAEMRDLHDVAGRTAALARAARCGPLDAAAGTELGRLLAAAGRVPEAWRAGTGRVAS